jgi:Family of unknown function (DUF5699)
MATLLWIIAVVLVIAGIVQLFQGQVLLGVVLIILGFLVGPGGVSIFAADAAGAMPFQQGDLEPDSPIGAWFTMSNVLVTLLVGSVVPFAVAFFSNPANPSWWKLALAGVFAEVGNLISNAVQDDGTAVFSQEHAVQLIVIFATALFAYARVWNPLSRDVAGKGLNAATGPGVLPGVGRPKVADVGDGWVRD